MPVKKDASGRRYVEAEVEVPGTPEDVWEAIATGPGISAWFVPAEVDGRVGGKTVCHFGPDDSMDSIDTITQWQPPHRFAAGTGEGPDTPATEWIVEAKSGGTCTVRVVHSWFADSDDWDSQYEGHAGGWLSFFKILRAYLERFPGEQAKVIQLAAQFSGTLESAFGQLMAPLGLEDGSPGQKVQPGKDAPEMSGEVIEVLNTPPAGFSVIVQLDRPAQSIAHFIGMPMGGVIYVSLRFYLYGTKAIARAGDIESEWQSWLDRSLAKAT